MIGSGFQFFGGDGSASNAQPVQSRNVQTSCCPGSGLSEQESVSKRLDVLPGQRFRSADQFFASRFLSWICSSDCPLSLHRLVLVSPFWDSFQGRFDPQRLGLSNASSTEFFARSSRPGFGPELIGKEPWRQNFATRARSG